MALTWLPDETLFSLCARFRKLSGHRLSAETCLELFGHVRLGTAHDFPCRIDRFCSRLDGRLGEPEDVIRHHTILPIFLPFISAERAAAAIRTLRGDRTGSLKFALGLAATGFRAAHPLKACPACMEEDVDRHGVSYWHVQHQLPGAWYCTRHRSPLSVSPLKINQVQRFAYLLPIEAGLKALVAAATNEVAYLLAVVLDELRKQPPGVHYDPERVTRTYHEAILERGFASRSGRTTDVRAASASLADFGRHLRDLPDMAPIPGDTRVAQRWISRCMRSTRSGTHPVRHALMVAWLFGTFDAFRSAYTQLDGGATTKLDSENVSSPAPPALGTRGAASLQQEFVEHLRNGRSIRQSSQAVGISATTGGVWASQNGIAIAKRTKRLFPPLLEKVEDMARLGLEKGEIERTAGVSRATVDRVLRSVPGLACAWSHSRQQRMVQSQRAEWQSLLADHPLIGVKGIRLTHPALHAWLYRNDREWLRANSPHELRVAHRKPKVHWDERDVALAAEVRHAVLAIHRRRNGARVRLVDIREQVHNLAPQLRHMDRLPLTFRAIEDALRGSRESARESLVED